MTQPYPLLPATAPAHSGDSRHEDITLLSFTLLLSLLLSALVISLAEYPPTPSFVATTSE